MPTPSLRPFLVRLTLVVLAASVSLAACDDAPPPESAVVVPEADIERFRTEVFLQTIPLDSALAAVESDAATAEDSTVRAAYAPLLERLREQRRRLQVRVDTLQPVPRAVFDSTTAQAERQIAALRAAIGRARLDATPTAPALRAAVAADFARLDGRLDAAAASDTTGRRQISLDSLRADRARLVGRLEAYPDTSAAQYGPFRERIVRDVLTLRQRAEAIAPDSTAVRALPRRPAR